MASFPAVTLPPGEGCFVFCFFPFFIIWSSICVDEYNHFQRIAKRSNCSHDLSCIQFFYIEKLKIWKDIRCVVIERELLKTCSDYEFGRFFLNLVYFKGNSTNWDLMMPYFFVKMEICSLSVSYHWPGVRGMMALLCCSEREQDIHLVTSSVTWLQHPLSPVSTGHFLPCDFRSVTSCASVSSCIEWG